MIVVDRLVQHYGVRPILKGVTLHIEAGELVALMGPNGMGKSTLLAAMAGVLTPQKGTVEINGLRRKSSPETEMAIRKQVYYPPDRPWLPLQRTGRELLLDIGRIYEVDDERLFDHIDRVLDLFALSGFGDAPMSSYSTGQQKKISIAAALVSEASILLLDEPFSGGLDPSALLALRKVMQRLAERDDVTVVMATPVPEIVEGLADRIVILRDGEIVAFDTTEGLKGLVDGAETLGEVLEQLIDPRTMEHLENYFEGDRK